VRFLIGCVAALVLTGCADPEALPAAPDAWSASATPPAAAPAPAGTAADMATRTGPATALVPWVDIDDARDRLEALRVKGRAPLTGYEREAFGSAWEDVNDNGCDTRNDILRRDLKDKRVEDCIALTGALRDPYSGERIDFTRGPVSSMDVQIDHVVALANAWQTGAFAWPPAKREAFANDRRNLLAVRGDLNLQKSDGDAATWLPPRKAFRCTYVALQVDSKARYGLWVTPAEKAAMQRVLEAC
jgi:hypothetical protein